MLGDPKTILGRGILFRLDLQPTPLLRKEMFRTRKSIRLCSWKELYRYRCSLE